MIWLGIGIGIIIGVFASFIFWIANHEIPIGKHNHKHL